MVADLPVEAGYINKELKRRQQGYGRGPRMEIEADEVEIISGIRYGLTTGSPIALLIPNRDWQNWQEIMSVAPLEKEAEPITRPRPGHADLAGVTKYNLKDIRPVMERASARETAARVAAGAIARRFLEEFGVVVHSYTMAIGGHLLEDYGVIDWQQVEASPVRCPSVDMGEEMMVAIDEAKANGDTLGGIFEVIATRVPIGLGSHVSWDRRLDGRISQAIMSINAVKGVAFGSGFALAKLKGSQAHDIIEPNPCATLKGAQGLPWRHVTNRAGGVEGGISNGEDIVVRAAVKPIATLAEPLSSVDLRSGEVAQAHYERSDVCVVPAAGVIGEAMLAIILADACLEKFGGDNLKETLTNYRNYQLSMLHRA
jgi:chorismate synthase